MTAKEINYQVNDLIKDEGNVDIISISAIEQNIVIVYQDEDRKLQIIKSDFKMID